LFKIEISKRNLIYSYIVILLSSYPFLVGLSIYFNQESFFFSIIRITLILLLSVFLLDFKNIFSKKKNIILCLGISSSLIIVFLNYDLRLAVYFICTILIPFCVIISIDFNLDNSLIKILTIFLVLSIFCFLLFYFQSRLFIISNIFFWSEDNFTKLDQFKGVLTNTVDYFYHNGFRLGIKSLNPISLANFISMTVIGIIFFSKRTFIRFIILIILFIAFINTGSKGPFLSLLFTLLIIFFLFKRNFIKLIVISFLFASSLQFGIEQFGNQKWDLFNRMSELVKKDSFDRSKNERIFAYKFFLKENKLINLSKNFMIETNEDTKSLNNNLGKSNFYHNLYLELYSLNKFFFVIILLMLSQPILFLFKNYDCLKKKSINQYLYGLFFYFLIEAIFSGFYPREEYLFFLLALIINQNSRLVSKSIN
jgi:hypothetical protein